MDAADKAFEDKKEEFVERLKPAFIPTDPVTNDIVQYFSSLLRVLGMEDQGWDPYVESKSVLNDINGFFKIDLPPEHFADPQKTTWRIGLILYSHIVEMDAPYEVLTNLLRFQSGNGYWPNPYFQFLTKKEQKNYSRREIPIYRKIEIIKNLSEETGIDIGSMFDEFYDNQLRNAIAHSDYILTEDDFRCRGTLSGTKAFRISYDILNQKIMAAKAFIAAFYQIELIARQVWGLRKNEAIPYDPHYKGLIEILVDDQDAMCGFKVHWPNNSESYYQRTEKGVDMVNCLLDEKGAKVDFFVGTYARTPGPFSPLVEHDREPAYTKLDGVDELPVWPNDIA